MPERAAEEVPGEEEASLPPRDARHRRLPGSSAGGRTVSW